METKFYHCKMCGNIIIKVIDGGTVPKCCGVEMEELKPNTTDGKTEYHLPVVLQCDDHKLKIRVGKEPHPMTAAHHIRFIYVETETGGHLVRLKDNQPAEVTLCMCDKPIAIYAYCNLHGIWKTALTRDSQCCC